MLNPPPETVTLAETERRILRAIRTLKVVRDPDAAYLRAGSRSSWPAILREWSDLLAQAENPDRDAPVLSPFQPTRFDLDDYLTALGWVTELAQLSSKRRPRRRRKGEENWPQDADQELLWLVAHGFSFQSIGRRGRFRGLHEEQIRRRYETVITNCWRIANGWHRPSPRDHARDRGAGAARSASGEGRVRPPGG
jgi:hypothetical protein